MDKELVNSGFSKLLNNQTVTSDELTSLVAYITSYTFPDMADDDRQALLNATVDTIAQVFATMVSNTIYRSFQVRFNQ